MPNSKKAEQEKFKFAVRCPAGFGGGTCNSPIYYDWGIQMAAKPPSHGVSGQALDKLSNWGSMYHVKICVRCSTPYIMEDGELVDVSSELGPEEVSRIIKTGQASLPHPAIKDP